MDSYTPEALLNTANLQLAPSEWVTIDQVMINSFADVTRDHQFIHVDPARAREEGPFDSTIAHGFLSMSLLSGLAEKCFPTVVGTSLLLNYGFDKLRFLAPVPCGARIRAHFELVESRRKSADRLLMTYAVRVEIENDEKPALVAHWLTLAVLSPE